MNFLKNNKWTIFGLCMVALFAITGDAYASTNTSDYSVNSGLEKIAVTKASKVFTSARNIMFVIGGFGLIAVSFAAIAGKMPWKWVGSLAIGLGIIAAATAVIEYGIDSKLDKGDAANHWKDTLS